MVGSRIDRADLEREPLWNGIEAAVAEGVAAQQAPARQERAASRAEAADRFRRVGRAARLVATTAWHRRGDPALVGDDQGEQQAFHVERLPLTVAASAS